MSLQLHRRSLQKKTFQFSLFTFISRILGLVREMLQVRLLGVSALSDAFLIAFRIPNSLRKVFAEGALSATFVPSFVKLAKSDGVKSANKLMSLGFIFFEGILLLLTILVWAFPEVVIKMIASGFSQEQLEPAIIFLRILFPFIFFLSSSALLAAALQAVNHFFTIAFSPVLLNIIYIAALIGCLYYGFSIKFLCYGILFSGLLQFLMAIFFYFKYQFGFSMPDSDSRKQFKSILIKFMHCLLGVGVMELNLIIDGNIGSYLADGSITLLYYGTRFMQIPLGVIAISFSTVLLSHLSRVVLYAPRRLNIYLLEASKFVVWATLPASLFLIFTAEKLFSTAIMAKNVSVAKVTQASFILIIMASGLLFFAINKVLTSIFYSRGDTYSPAVSGGIATIINLVGNLVSLQFLGKNAIYGIAGSTVLFGIFQTVISFYQLHKKFKYHFYAANFFGFLVRYSLQIIIVSSIFVFLHNIFFSYLKLTDWYYFFYFNWGYWIIVVPLGLSTGYLLFLTRKLFNIELYFLGK